MRKLLVVIDMQNDFIDGSLENREAQAIIGKVASKMLDYPAENILVTRDTHPVGYLASREGKYLPVEHCIEGTEGWDLHPEISKILREKGSNVSFFDKNGFASLELVSYIEELAQKEEISVELVGICTDICVISNALLIKAHLPEIDISVDASCCAGVTPQKHAAALEVMNSCQIDISNG